MQLKRLPAVDSLRGIASLGVAIFAHYGYFKPAMAPFSKKAYWFWSYAWSLVELFFIISGFVFCYVYKDRIANKEISLKEYMVLRFSRLYPLLFVTLIFVGTIQTIRMIFLHNFFAIPTNDAYHFLLNLFSIQSFGFELNYSFNAPSWSVSCELIAYILFFVFVSKYSKENKYIIAYIAAIFIGLTISKLNWNYPLLDDNTSRVYIGFFVGCFIYELNKYINGNGSKNRNKVILLSSILLGIVIIGATTYGNVVLGEKYRIIYATLIYPLIVLLVLNVKFLNYILSMKALQFLGKISFSIYLWHLPIMITIKTVDDLFKLNINYSSRIFFFVFIAIIIIVATMSYEIIENPSNKYLRTKLLPHKSDGTINNRQTVTINTKLDDYTQKRSGGYT